MKKIQTAIAVIFGISFLALATLIVAETLIRKIFNASLQGVDELSGYVLAFGATLAFANAVLKNAHMRIDLFYKKFPLRLKSFLNLVSVLSIALLALFLFYVGVQVVNETRFYGSTAATPWATPLIYPQTFWLVGSFIFALVACWQLVRVCILFFKGRWQQLNQSFDPSGSQDELKDELESQQKRAQQHGGELANKEHESTSFQEVSS